MVGALYGRGMKKRSCVGIVVLLFVLLRFVWLFQSYAIFKKISN